MHELMFQAGVKGMSERSELIPCMYYYIIVFALIFVKLSLSHCEHFEKYIATMSVVAPVCYIPIIFLFNFMYYI